MYLQGWTRTTSLKKHEVDLAPGTTYRYRVKLETMDHGDVYSEVLLATTQSELPMAPTGLMATRDGTTVTLAWTIPEQPEWVEVSHVYVRRPPAGVTNDVGTVDWQSGMTAYRFEDAVPVRGYSYSYRILMIAGAGTKATSSLWRCRLRSLRRPTPRRS